MGIDARRGSAAPHFAEVSQRRYSRRSVLAGGVAGAATFLVAGTPVGALPTAERAPIGLHAPVVHRRGSRLGFDAVPPGFGDEIVVPPGYSARPFIPWGTPILGHRPPFAPGTPPTVDGGNTADDQACQVGMHHDGMHYFPLLPVGRWSDRGLLVLNHEYTDEGLLHTAHPQPLIWPLTQRAIWTEEMVRKSQQAHGVSVVEVRRRRNGTWTVLRSPRNRRITATTPMRFAGPAAGHRLLRTSADPAGTSPVGTCNNCAHGVTPWRTYLTCEENTNLYFQVEPGAYGPEREELHRRFAVGVSVFNWALHDPRFVVTADDPNEPNRFGWVVEIDPFDPTSTPVKRTALGRLKHEGAFVHVARGGRVVVYMGDDQADEHVYKFVSARSWRSMAARGRSPLDEGTLHVARFDEDGTGEWLPLVHGEGPLVAANGFADQGDVLVKARLAATALGATPMDRPEWTAVDRRSGAVYCTLTNSSGRTTANAANPRTPNPWGHIVRWFEHGGDHTATRFRWDLFLLAGPGRDSDEPDGSTVLAEDAFGSPDGLHVDPDGRVWIQTDGDQPGGANDQLLAADPGRLDDEGVPEVRRFLTAVPGCEVTGAVTTPDQRTVFVNVQHPGEDGAPSTWPHDSAGVPRSATVVVTRDDGGTIGG